MSLNSRSSKEEHHCAPAASDQPRGRSARLGLILVVKLLISWTLVVRARSLWVDRTARSFVVLALHRMECVP